MYSPIVSWRKRERRMAKNGYIQIEVPEHPRARQGWVYEHILVAEREYGLLRSWETVHHINEIKTDNSPENLFVCDRSWHDHAHNMASVSHRKMNNSQKGKACEGCGKVFYGKPHAIKRRRFCHAACRRQAYQFKAA